MQKGNYGVFKIKGLHEFCSYYHIRYLFKNKRMKRVTVEGLTSGYYEFMFDEDREAVNRKEGWSEKKTRYLLERPVVESLNIKADVKQRSFDIKMKIK